MTPVKRRCAARHPEGYGRCDLSAGHDRNHFCDNANGVVDPEWPTSTETEKPSTLGLDPRYARCEICRTSAALSAGQVLYPLTVRGPKRDYVHYLCADCVKLFNTNNWGQTRHTLRRELRSR